MDISTNNKKGNSIENPIVIGTEDSLTGVTLEHGYIDKVVATLDAGVESIQQNLIIENGRHFDRFDHC